MMYKRINHWIVLCMLVLGVGSATRTLAQAIDCGCPEDDAKFKDVDYFKSFYSNFKTACLTDAFYIENVENKNVTAILKRILQISGTAQQVGLSLKQEIANLFKVLPKVDSESQAVLKQWVTKAGTEVRNTTTVKIWTAFIACQSAQLAQNYYFKYPEDAPAAHQKFYKKNTSPIAIKNDLNFALDPITIGLLAAVLLLSVLISSIIAGSIVKKRLSKHQLKVEDVVQDPLFLEWVKSITSPVNTSLNEQKNLKKSIEAQNQKINEIKALGDKLEKVIKQSGAVDVDKLQQVLSDLSKRVKDLEDLPVRRENLRIVLQPEDFMNWLQNNPEIKEAVKEGLDIVQIRDMVTKLLPHPLSMKELGDLDKETIARYWRIFRGNQEYLPTFTEELRKEWSAKK